MFCIMYVANKAEKAELVCVLLLFEKGRGQKGERSPQQATGSEIGGHLHLSHYKTKGKRFY